jgi:hypothetical protein
MALDDRIGKTYAQTRKSEPRLAAKLLEIVAASQASTVEYETKILRKMNTLLNIKNALHYHKLYLRILNSTTLSLMVTS